MSRWRRLPNWSARILAGVCATVSLTAFNLPASALTLEQGPEGFIVHLTTGESLRDAWWAIRGARLQGAPVGVQDVIQLGAGVFPFTDELGNTVLHYSSGGGLVAPPLVIRGAGPTESYVHCPPNDGTCAVSYFGLIFEDVGILVTPGGQEALMRITNSNLTLRRVAMVGQTLPVTYVYNGAIDVFNGYLTIEDSVLADNEVVGGQGLIQYHGNQPYTVGRIVRSTLSGNAGRAVLDTISPHLGRLEVEQSTLVDNETVVFLGSGTAPVSVTRSILTGPSIASGAQLTVTDSFTEGDPALEADGFGNRIPRPASPVVDVLACTAHGFDQRGEPTGVLASYRPPRETPCDQGAIEAQQQLCMATSQGTVACEDGSLDDVAELPALGCLLIGGVLDCTDGEEAEVTYLGLGDSVPAGDAELILQGDGNLVLFEASIPQWETGTNASPCVGSLAEVQADGTLVVFSDPQAPGGATACFTSGTPGQRVLVQEGFRGARLVAEQADGSLVPISDRQPIGSEASFALYGSRFAIDDALTLPGTSAVMQGDGDFVLYDTLGGIPTPLWSTATAGACAGEDAVFRLDGNLVIGEPGSSCFAAVEPPAGGTVLRLHRSPLGPARLSILNGQGEVLWQVPEPPVGIEHCGDLPVDAPDGAYTVIDSTGVEREVFCDMTGGGWMLVGKVFRSHQGADSLDEPDDWWTAGTGPTEALTPGVVDWVDGFGLAAYGAAWLADLELDVARFDLIAEDALFFEDIDDAVPGETASWYKGASTIATWFTAGDTPSAVCDDAALSCPETGRIHHTGDGTWLEGMQLTQGGGPIHLRTNGDSRAHYDGTCSYTFNDPTWLDDAAEHWGNGLDVWVKGPARSRCADFPAGSPDGVYRVVDSAGVEREVYCDMAGGGWMLVGKVLRSHHGASGLSEPDDWWTHGTGQAGALPPGVVDHESGLNVLAYGTSWLAELSPTVARFDLIAEDADPSIPVAEMPPSQTATWYKDASTLTTWFLEGDTPSAVCATQDLACSTAGRIYRTSSGTWFEGMQLPDAGGPIHTRPDGDAWPAFDGVCSYTAGEPSWLDDAAGHWGNGLDVWVK